MRTLLTRSARCAGVVLFFASLAAVTTRAQIPGGSSVHAPGNQTPSDAAFDTHPFDPSLIKLPPGYRGVNLLLLERTLRAREQAKVKDEFETTAQFNDRMSKLETAPILGDIRRDSIIAFATPDVEAHYDADQELMNVALDPADAFSIKLGPEARQIFTAGIKMDIPVARKTKPNILALGVAKSPDLADGQRLRATLLEVWFFDNMTGEVLAKKKAEMPKAGEDVSDDGSYSPKEMLARARRLYDARLDERALPLLRRVLVLEPTSAEAFLLLGQIDLRLGDTKAAISALKTAVFWEPKTVDAYILLARIFRSLGDRAQALTYARNAVEADPNSKEAITLYQEMSKAAN